MTGLEQVLEERWPENVPEARKIYAIMKNKKGIFFKQERRHRRERGLCRRFIPYLLLPGERTIEDFPWGCAWKGKSYKISVLKEADCHRGRFYYQSQSALGPSG